MLAIDANVVVRYLTGDRPDQSARARAIIDGEPVFVATTVLLEVEWVLRSGYGYRAPLIATTLAAFAGLPTVSLENPAAVAAALKLHGRRHGSQVHASSSLRRRVRGFPNLRSGVHKGCEHPGRRARPNAPAPMKSGPAKSHEPASVDKMR